MKKGFFTGILTALAVVAAAAEFPVGSLQGKLAIDGELNEPAWVNAPKYGDFKLLASAGSGKSPKNQTEVRVLCDKDNVYFGITCLDSGKITANLPKGYHTNPWLDDVVEIFLCPNGQPSEMYQFVISAGGASIQQYWAERGNIRPDTYLPFYEYATKVSQGKWVAEVRIPFRALYLTPCSQWQSKWRVNVARWQPGTSENSTWGALRDDNFDSDNYPILTGFPKKSSALDVYVQDASFKMTRKTGNSGVGTITVTVVAQSELPDGQYEFFISNTPVKQKLTTGQNKVSWQNVAMAKAGLQKIRFTVKNAAGKCVHEREFPVRVNFEEQSVKFTAPQFSETFYPGEDASHLKGEIELATLRDKVTMEVAGKKYEFPVKDGHAAFDVDLTGVKFPAQVKIGSYQVNIRKVASAKAWIHDCKVVLGGKPTVLLGWYGAAFGNVGWIWSHACAEKYPTPAAKSPFNVPVLINLEPARLLYGAIEAEEMVKDQKPSQKVYDAIRKAVEASRDSESYIYYLCDEPECRGISPVYLRYLYQYIRELDPTRLVLVISREPVRFVECADLICPHPYTSPQIDDHGVRKLSTSITIVRDMCKQVGDLQRPDKVLMLTPQAFSYAFNDYYADYPSYDESRASCWSCFVHGGQGLYPFIYYEVFSRPELDLGYTEIYETADRLNPWLTGKYTLLDVKNADGALFSKNASSHLVALVNYQPTAQTVTAKGIPDGSYYRFREARQISVKNGTLAVKLAPYQVLLLTTEKCDGKLESMEALRKRIAEAEYARHNRGNILHGKGRQIAVDFPDSRPYTTQNAMEQQDKMFDGTLEVCAWQPRDVEGDLWYELSFTAFVPKFSKARIYGNDLQGLTFKIWKFGKWITPEVTVKEGKYCVELDFGKTLSTVKVHLDFVKREHLELYEIELLK